jgi:hypothetical protein
MNTSNLSPSTLKNKMQFPAVVTFEDQNQYYLVVTILTYEKEKATDFNDYETVVILDHN